MFERIYKQRSRFVPKKLAIIKQEVHCGPQQNEHEFAGHAISLLHQPEAWLAAHDRETRAKIEQGYAAAQRYLDSLRYRNVTVFCMEGGCRNNVGEWPMQKITAADPSRKDFAYYSTKDRAMVDEADYGLMLWDGRSRGTLRSIIDLVRHSKPVIAYVAPVNSFYTLRQSDDIAEMLSRVDPAALQGIDSELRTFAMAGGSARKNDNLPLF